MIVSRIVYDTLCQIYGEAVISRFYAPISVVRR